MRLQNSVKEMIDECVAPAADVRRNCMVPSPKTSFFMAFSLAMDSSRPISKRKNTIPSSPECEVQSRSETNDADTRPTDQ